MTAHPHRGHSLSAGTHTLEMGQLTAINDRLAQTPGPTAAELGLVGTPVHGTSGRSLPGEAAISQVIWAGTPGFPDVAAKFVDRRGSDQQLVVDLHTAALRELSHRLGLRHTWGVGPPRPGS